MGFALVGVMMAADSLNFKDIVFDVFKKGFEKVKLFCFVLNQCSLW
jgi:hypothetical protein